MSDSYEIVDRSHQLDGSTTLLSAYYGDWATTYEKDAHNLGYQGPRMLADLFTRVVPQHLCDNKEIVALDAGCGTGLAGPLLIERGVTVLDGLDLNHEMVTQAAKTGAYRLLSSGVDLNLGLHEFAADTFDVTVSLGVFTTGHVQPVALEGLLRVTRPGGLVLLSTSRRYIEDTDFEKHLDALAAEQRVTVLECNADQTYLNNETAHYWVLKIPRA